MHHLSVLIFVSSYILVKIVLKFAFNLRANLVATVPQTIQHFQFDLVNTATTMMICFPLKNVFKKLWSVNDLSRLGAYFIFTGLRVSSTGYVCWKMFCKWKKAWCFVNDKRFDVL